MVDSKKNYKFDLGGKGLTHGIKFSQLEGLPIVQSVYNLNVVLMGFIE